MALVGPPCYIFVLSPDVPEVAAAVKEALAEVGSTNMDNFELKYNVDILSPVVKHAEPEVCVCVCVCVHGVFVCVGVDTVHECVYKHTQ